MSMSTRLPSGGTILAISLPSLARIVDTWLVRTSPGCGTLTIRYASEKVTRGSSTIRATLIATPLRTHFQLIRRGCCGRGGVGGLAPSSGGGGGPGDCCGPPPGRFDDSVRSNAALTTSMSSWSGAAGWGAAGMTAVGGTSEREGGRANGGRGSRAVGSSVVLLVSGALGGCGRGWARSAAVPCRISVAGRSGRSSLFTGHARVVARRPRAPRSRWGTHRAEHVRLDQVIPAAGPAYLHHVYREFVVSGCQHHQLFGAAGRTGYRTEVIAKHPRHQCQLLPATDRAHHRTGLAVIFRSPQQVGIGVADLGNAGTSGVHLGQQ